MVLKLWFHNSGFTTAIFSIGVLQLWLFKTDFAIVVLQMWFYTYGVCNFGFAVVCCNRALAIVLPHKC